MDSEILFYDDNKRGKRNWLIITSFLIFCFIGWTASFILSLTIKTAGFTPNNFADNLSSNIFIILLLVLILSLIVYMFIFRFTSKRFKQKIIITKSNISFIPSINNIDIIDATKFVSFEVVYAIKNVVAVKLVFDNNAEVVFKTSKFNELKLALMYIKKDSNELIEQQ